jgi:Lrp/AsnC family transcriptional regulator, leucine-responsive regulatory protein
MQPAAGQISKDSTRSSFEREGLLDSIGWRILCELQANSRLSFSELGRRVGLTPPAAAERVRRLEEAGVIAGYRLELNVERLGLPLLAWVRLAPRGGVPPSEIKAAVASLTDVLECHHVTGEDCYVMKVAVASVRELEGLLERLLKFGNTTTSIVISSPVTGRIIGPPSMQP